MKKFTSYILIVTAVLLMTNVSFAQKENERKNFSDEIGNVMKQKLMDNAKFDEATADKFINLLRENNKQLRVYNKEKLELMQSINLDPEAPDMESKLEKIIELDTKILDLRKSHYNELKTFLSPQQIAKSMVFTKKFAKEFRKQMRNRKNNRNPEDFNK